MVLHSSSQDVEITTRLEIAERTGFTSIAQDDTGSLRHDLDTLLRNTWADTLAETRRLSKAPKQPRNMIASCENEGRQLTFRLLSSMKHPQHISLHPKPLPAPVSREPDSEDDKAQAETRRIRSLSVAVESDCLGSSAVATRQMDPKPVTVGGNASLTDMTLAGPLPPFLVMEEVCARKAARRLSIWGLPAPSPHEPRPSCAVLPVISVPDQREASSKKRRKSVRERPSPTYWRPSPDQRGKSMGYALGYPSSWAPGGRYVRDVMKKGAESISACHAVHGNAKSE